jgi:mannose-6-phosphate isomerase-like protein (cupin superfamily)
MKNGLASETLGHWGNHLLLKTRREASSGQAEWHERQADLIVVQSGQATILIGGKIINAKTTAANEIRGTSIEGGEKQALKAGDVVHVPAKTPHQVLLDAEQTLDCLWYGWIRRNEEFSFYRRLGEGICGCVDFSSRRRNVMRLACLCSDIRRHQEAP